jgi:hypothetical protein
LVWGAGIQDFILSKQTQFPSFSIENQGLPKIQTQKIEHSEIQHNNTGQNQIQNNRGKHNRTISDTQCRHTARLNNSLAIQ